MEQMTLDQAKAELTDELEKSTTALKKGALTIRILQGITVAAAAAAVILLVAAVVTKE